MYYYLWHHNIDNHWVNPIYHLMSSIYPGQDPTPASVCNSGGAWTMSNSDMILMTVASIGGVIIIFTLVLIGVCCHFKKQLKAIR